MDLKKNKKITAAMAAISRYIAEMEAVVAQPEVPVSANVLPLWSLAGRQEAMALRAIWQRRLAKSW